MDVKKLLPCLVFLAIININVVSSEEFGYNLLESPDFNNATAFVNASAKWITPSLGVLDDVNDTQFSNNGGTLNIIEAWIDSLWCRLTGCTMEGDIDMDGNDIYMETGNIFNATEISLNGDYAFLNITTNLSGAEESQINIVNTHPFGFGGIRYVNNDGDQGFAGLFSRAFSELLFPNVVGPNESASGLTSIGGPIFIVTTYNKSIYMGTSPNESLADGDFTIKVDPSTSSLTLQGDKSLTPKIANGGNALVFDSEDALSAGGFPFVFEAQDSNNKTVILSWNQNGANNSFSGNMNSFVTVPKSWIEATISNDTSSDVSFLFNTSNYPNLCDWLQTNLSLIPEGCKYFADTIGRLVPMAAFGDLEIWRTATIHEGLTAFNALDFIGRNGNDVNMLFNGGLEDGKLHIRDKRQILANISFFDAVITDFDDGTISPFVSESIAPEVGRDWDSILSLSCHQDRCGNSKGGSEKVMAFSGSTQFENGTVASSNTRLMFWITSVLSGADTFEVELDNNEGDVSTIYSTSATLVDQFVNVSFGAAFENRTNVTTRFILNGQNANRQVWVDIIQVTSEPAESIIINETYDGGKIVLGEDMGNNSCLIESTKILDDVTLQPEWVLNLGSPNCNLAVDDDVGFTGNCVNTSYSRGIAIGCND